MPCMPDNRDLATAILLVGFVVFGLTVRSSRERIPDVIRAVAPLTWLLTLYLTAASLIIWGAWSVGLWAADLWWSTSIVVLGLGVSLLSSAIESRSVRALWESIKGKTIGAAIFIGLYANLATFPLVVELVLQALATLTVMVRVVADHQGQKPVRKLADAVLGGIGLAFLARTTIVLAHDMPEGDWLGWLKQTLLSIWFPFALVPLLYLVAYLSTAEIAVVGVRIIKPREIKKWPIMWRFLLAFRLRLSLAAAFGRPWGRRYAVAEGSSARRAVVARFRKVERPRFAVARPSTIARVKRALGRPDGFATWNGHAMPRCPSHLTHMLDSKPPAWEWMAFGAHLWMGMAKQQHKYRAHHRRHIARAGGDQLDVQESIPHLRDLLEAAGRLPESVIETLSEARQEEAFGSPGEAGNADDIRLMANEIISTYLGLIEWASEVRGTRVPFRYRRAYRAAARLMDGPVEQIRHFVSSLAEQLDAVPEHLASGSTRPLNITLELALSIRAEDQARFDRALGHPSNETTGALLEPQAER